MKQTEDPEVLPVDGDITEPENYRTGLRRALGRFGRSTR